MKTRRDEFVIGCLALALTAALWFNTPYTESSSQRVVHAEGSVARPDESPAIAPRDRPATVEPERAALRAVAPAEEGHSPLADQLNAPGRKVSDDLAVVLNLFTQYRKRFDGYPSGEENAAFVNALAGNNPARMAFIDRAHPAIDAKGQLCDRWGSPLFFHLLSRDALEIRTAGPDRELYTVDDQIIESPVLRAERLASSP
jgi:hypothetical protein